MIVKTICLKFGEWSRARLPIWIWLCRGECMWIVSISRSRSSYYSCTGTGERRSPLVLQRHYSDAMDVYCGFIAMGRRPYSSFIAMGASPFSRDAMDLFDPIASRDGHFWPHCVTRWKFLSPSRDVMAQRLSSLSTQPIKLVLENWCPISEIGAIAI